MRSDAPRAKQKQETRRHVLASAQKVFATKGYGATQVRDIVKSAGVSIGTFYHYFDSKEEAFNELVLAGSRGWVLYLDNPIFGRKRKYGFQ